jgi:hypothetical protein
LVIKLFKDKYLSRSCFLESNIGHNLTYVCQRIWSAKFDEWKFLPKSRIYCGVYAEIACLLGIAFIIGELIAQIIAMMMMMVVEVVVSKIHSLFSNVQKP